MDGDVALSLGLLVAQTVIDSVLVLGCEICDARSDYVNILYSSNIT